LPLYLPTCPLVFCSIKYSGECAVAVAGKGKNVVGVFKKKTVKLYDLKDGKLLTTVQHPDTSKLIFCASLPTCVAGIIIHSLIISISN